MKPEDDYPPVSTLATVALVVVIIGVLGLVGACFGLWAIICFRNGR